MATCCSNAKTSAPFAGDWYDTKISYGKEVTQRYNQTGTNRDNAEFVRKTLTKKYKLTYQKKITSTDDLLKDASGGTGRSDLFNDKVLPKRALPEEVGLAYHYSKKLQTVVISFDLEGVATCQAMYREDLDTHYTASNEEVIGVPPV